VQRRTEHHVLGVAAIAATLLLSESIAAASFPCEKAATPVEKMICSDTTLSELDEHLGRYYGAARAQLGRGGTCLATNQRQWLSSMRNACTDTTCLKRVYLARLAELDPLQPGATAIKAIELPRVDSLAWIVPPEEDEVAAPRNPNAPALLVRGRILDEVAGGDGFVVQAADGKRYVLLPLMFISKSNATTLELLAREADTLFEVRGQREDSSDGSAHFAPGACTFVYRLTK